MQPVVDPGLPRGDANPRGCANLTIYQIFDRKLLGKKTWGGHP